MDSHASLFSRDRRFAQRHNIKTALRVRVCKSGLPEERAESLNLSQRRIFFATNSRLAEGEVVEILLKMPQEIRGEPTTEWRCTGHVVRVEPADLPKGKFGVGVHFYCYEASRAEQPPLYLWFQGPRGTYLPIMSGSLPARKARALPARQDGRTSALSVGDASLQSHLTPSRKGDFMNASKKLASGRSLANSFLIHPKIFIFLDKSTGTTRFQVQACADGSLPVDQAVSLLAVRCLARQKMPRDFAIMVATSDDLLSTVVSRTMQVIQGCSGGSPRPHLSQRQHEVLAGITQNLSNKEIAPKLHISERTVKFHVSTLLQKFEVSGRVDLMLEAGNILSHEAVHKREHKTERIPASAGPSPAATRLGGRPRLVAMLAGNSVH